MPGQHAKLSPSGAHRWMPCPGSVVLEAPLEDTSSFYANEGTVAHWLAAWALETGTDNVVDYMTLYPDGRHTCMDDERNVIDIPITAEMCNHVQLHVDYVRREAGEDADVEIETRVHYHNTVGLPEGEGDGSADAIILRDESFTITDLKYGMGEVSATDNKQLALYALGVVEDFGHLADFKTAKMTITQPRLDRIDEWEIPIEELMAFAPKVAQAATLVAQAEDAHVEIPVAENGDAHPAAFKAWQDSYLEAGEAQCQWCRAKTTCPALREYIANATGADFENLAQGMEDLTVPPAAQPAELGQAMSKIKLIEGWCKAVRAETERALIAGEAVEGWKLVEGRKGARSWTSEEDATALLKAKFRLKIEQMYDMKLISPTKAAELLKDSPKRWKQVEKLIEQRDGKPSVAPESDKRPAISVAPTADGMEDLSAPAATMETMTQGFMDDLMG